MRHDMMPAYDDAGTPTPRYTNIFTVADHDVMETVALHLEWQAAEMDELLGGKHHYQNQEEYYRLQEAEYDALGEKTAYNFRLYCHQCRILVPVEKLGPVVEAHRDPTQSYKLICGHHVI